MHKHYDGLRLWLIKAAGLANHLKISYSSKIPQTLVITLERKAEMTSFCLFPNQPERGPFVSTFQAGKTDETGRVSSNNRKVRQSDFVRQAYRDDATQRYQGTDKIGCFCPLRFLEQCLTLQSDK